MIVTDYNGNIIPWTGTQQEALEKGYNINCIDCKYCMCCKDCTHCTHCTNCAGCKDCTACIDCTNCTSQPLANIKTPQWAITIRNNHTMKIGCQDHPVSDWLAFTDEQISEMDRKALTFWKQWKPVIVAFYSN